MLTQTVTRGRILIGRLDKDTDLLKEFTGLCVTHGISFGNLLAIGAVSRAVVGFYQQGHREYESIVFDQPHEIIGLQGNISLKDGRPFVHAHIALMSGDGNMFGGHLMEGSKVFACEYKITEFIPENQESFTRVMDEETGLFLWPKD